MNHIIRPELQFDDGWEPVNLVCPVDSYGVERRLLNLVLFCEIDMGCSSIWLRSLSKLCSCLWHTCRSFDVLQRKCLRVHTSISEQSDTRQPGNRYLLLYAPPVFVLTGSIINQEVRNLGDSWQLTLRRPYCVDSR